MLKVVLEFKCVTSILICNYLMFNTYNKLKTPLTGRPWKFNIQIRADVPNTFAKKNGEKVQERLLTCIDLTPEVMMADSLGQ